MQNESAPPEDHPLLSETVKSKWGKLFIRAMQVIGFLVGTVAGIATVADVIERHLR